MLVGLTDFNMVWFKEIPAQELADKLNTLEEAVNPSVIKGFDRIFKDLKNTFKAYHGGGGSSDNYETITSSKTIKTNTKMNFVDASGGNITLTLPPASEAARREYHIKKVDVSSYTVNIQTPGSETIDRETDITITKTDTSRRLYSDGNNYWII